jgi:hypothetical protein
VAEKNIHATHTKYLLTENPLYLDPFDTPSGSLDCFHAY